MDKKTYKVYKENGRYFLYKDGREMFSTLDIKDFLEEVEDLLNKYVG